MEKKGGQIRNNSLFKRKNYKVQKNRIFFLHITQLQVLFAEYSRNSI